MLAGGPSLWKSAPILSTDTLEAVLESRRSSAERGRANPGRKRRSARRQAASSDPRFDPGYPQHMHKSAARCSQAAASALVRFLMTSRRATNCGRV